MEHLNIYLEKIKKILNLDSINTNDEENIIDLQKTFSSDGINIIPVIKKILNLDIDFPENIIKSHHGTKYKELEFFNSNMDSNLTDNIKTVFDNINKTQTKLGSYLLQSTILLPFHNKSDINILLNRQNVINDFISNNQTHINISLDHILNSIKKIKHLENDILSMSLPDTPEMKEVYNLIYFQLLPLKMFNYNELFMKIFYYFIIVFTPIYGIISPFMFIFIPFLFMKYIMKIPITLNIFWVMVKNIILGGTGIFNILGKVFNAASENNKGSFNSLFTGEGITIKSVILYLAKLIVLFIGSTWGNYAYIAFIGISYLYGIYNSFQISIMYNKVINMLHSRLNIMSEWIKECMKLYNNKVLFNLLELEPIIKKIDNIIQNPTLQNLITCKTFNMTPELFSNKGIIIKVFKEFLDAKEQMQIFMEPFSHYMAYVDMYSAISLWMREPIPYATNQFQYTIPNKTFAIYDLDSEKPYIQGNNIWNVCCNPPVCNNINIGFCNPISTIATNNNTEININSSNSDVILETTAINSNSSNSDVILESTAINSNSSNSDVILETTAINNFRTMLITGANGTGKSTYIKSIIECIILSQTIGIAPAEKFILTPFKNITTYLNIPDCQGKESLFQAEMSRCLNQLNILEKSEQDGEFSFNIMDEIFVSTNYQEGMSGAYAIIKQLGKYEKCINIITTHYDVLAEIPELQLSKYYFDINIDDNENITKDYKVKYGVSKKHMALRLLKQKGFNTDIIKDAEYLYNKLQTLQKNEKI
jgi:hypothetical protein